MLRGKLALGIGRSIVVDHALDIARGYGAQSNGLDIAEKGHGHAGLVAIGMRYDHTRLVCPGLQYRADERIELRVDQHHGLGMPDSVQRHAGAEIDAAGHLHDQVDGIASSQHLGIVGNDGHPPGDPGLGVARRPCGLPLPDSRLSKSALGVLWSPVRHPGKPDSRHRGSQLQRDRAPGSARTHDSDADGTSFGLTPLQRAVDGGVGGRHVGGFPTHAISPLSDFPQKGPATILIGNR